MYTDTCTLESWTEVMQSQSTNMAEDDDVTVLPDGEIPNRDPRVPVDRGWACVGLLS
jgi:hypothetical protein